jgi:hypothetical protein
MLYPARFGNDPLFPQSTDFSVVFKDEMTGLGVVSYRSFSAGEVIAKMAGEVVEDIRQHTLQISPTEHLFDPHFSGYFLHACEPNISLNMSTMLVTALKDISEGDYLYMDYAETEDYLFKQFPCSCGAASCRGWIGGRLDVMPMANKLMSKRAR